MERKKGAVKRSCKKQDSGGIGLSCKSNFKIISYCGHILIYYFSGKSTYTWIEQSSARRDLVVFLVLNIQENEILEQLRQIVTRASPSKGQSFGKE